MAKTKKTKLPEDQIKEFLEQYRKWYKEHQQTFGSNPDDDPPPPPGGDDDDDGE